MCVNLHLYISQLENSIAPRDLVAIAAEDSDDANLLMEQFRDRMKLRANVVTVQSEVDMKKYAPDEKKLEYFNKNKKELDFKGYLSDLFQAPDPIKAFLCQQYSLHKIPIFGAKAETHTQKLLEMDVLTFFIGEVRNSTTISKYGNRQKSTLSSKVFSKNWMHMSLDKEQINQVDLELKKIQEEHSNLHQRMRECIENQKNSERLVEAKKKDMKDLQQKLQYKKVLKGKLMAKSDQMRALEKEANAVDVEKERSRIVKEKRQYIAQTVRLNADLKSLLGKLAQL